MTDHDDILNHTEPQQAQRAFVLSSLAVAFVMNMAWFGVYTFVNAYLVNALGATNAAWTETTLWFVSGILVGQLLATELASRIGRRETIALALVGASIGYLVIASTRDIAMIRITLAIIGFAPSTITVLWFAAVAEFGGREPGKALTTFMLISTLVGAVVLWIGGQLISFEIYRPVFVGTGVISLLCTAVFYVQSRHVQGTSSGRIVSIFRLSRQQVKAVVSCPLVMILALGYTAEPFLYLTVNQLFPNIGRDLFSLSEGAIGMTVGLGRLPCLLVLFVMRRYIDRLNPGKCYGSGLLLLGITVMFMGNSGSAGQVMMAYLCFYTIYGIIWSANATALNLTVTRDLRDIAFALGATTQTVFVMVAGVVHTGMLGRAMALPQVFMVCGIIGIVGGTGLIVGSRFVPAWQRRTPERDSDLESQTVEN